jgi:hypothetical protein
VIFFLAEGKETGLLGCWIPSPISNSLATYTAFIGQQLPAIVPLEALLSSKLLFK